MHTKTSRMTQTNRGTRVILKEYSFNANTVNLWPPGWSWLFDLNFDLSIRPNFFTAILEIMPISPILASVLSSQKSIEWEWMSWLVLNSSWFIQVEQNKKANGLKEKQQFVPEVYNLTKLIQTSTWIHLVHVVRGMSGVINFDTSIAVDNN